MLRKFTVTNFKNYKDKVSIDFSSGNYAFNDEIVKNGIITKAIVYGINGSGKSNLGLAVFDIIFNLTDKQKIYEKYSAYLNLSSRKTTADFEYEFDFDGNSLVYRYRKQDLMVILSESVEINGREVLSYDFVKNEGYSLLKGTENLKLISSNPEMNRISRVKFIKNTTILDENDKDCITFNKFSSFVENMLMFYSLDERAYQGLKNGPESTTSAIINAGKLKDFENFLRDNDIDYNFKAVDVGGRLEIFCDFGNNRLVHFWQIASTGTKSLTIFYYWYISMSRASFVFIDEYDAFYHFELSEKMVETVKSLKDVQVVFTTHNTDLLSNDLLRPDAYYIIQDNKIKTISNLTEKEIRYAHNLQKMYKAGAFIEK